MATAKPIPLFPTYEQLSTLQMDDYPQLKAFLDDNENAEWFNSHWSWGKDFLMYIGRNKSKHTYTRFRNEVERFLLWSMIVKEKPLDQFRKVDILEFADFCWKPPVNWIGTASIEKFELINGYYQTNSKWHPFKMQAPKSQANKDVDKKKYRPSQQTLLATFTAISSFYNYLMNEELCLGNPAQIAKKDCRYFIKDAQVKEIKRLNEAQWKYVLDTASKLADRDGKYERSLFVIAALKVLFLRISELSERERWSPEMRHFWQDENNNWWLKIYGKGRKLRDITVPEDFLRYLIRYREKRGLSPLPSSGENTVLVEKIRGQGGMTARHLRRLVQEVFDIAYDQMKRKDGEEKAMKLKEASTHWLRHTGASMEVERGRALKDLSEDLGHASMATTDTIYVQTENKKRAESGKNRKVD